MMYFQTRRVIQVALLGAAFAIIVGLYCNDSGIRFDCSDVDNEIVYHGSDKNTLIYYEQRKFGRLIDRQNTRDESYSFKVVRELYSSRDKIAINGLLALESARFREGWKFKDISCRRTFRPNQIANTSVIELQCFDSVTHFTHNITWSKKKGVERIKTDYRPGESVVYVLVSRRGLALPC